MRKSGVLMGLAMAMGLAACAPPTHYFGIDLRQPITPQGPLADPEVDPEMEAIIAAAEEKDCSDPANADQPSCARLRRAFQERILANGKYGFVGRDMSREPLVIVAREAQAGNNYAQLELGIRFEEGRDVEQDLDNALALYRRAATTSGGQVAVWIPNTNTEGGTINYVDTGPIQPGLQEARERRDALLERMSSGRQ